MDFSIWRQKIIFTCVFCLAWLVCVNALYGVPCRSNSECGEGYCCARKRGAHYCMRNRQLGEFCSNTYVKGRTLKCGCEKNLTCAVVLRDERTGYAKHRCVEIPPEAKELQDKNNNFKSSTITNILSSIELGRLLKLIEGRPTPNTKP